MAQMTDPAHALASFEHEFRAGRIPLTPGRLDRDILVFVDEPLGNRRFTYVTVSNSDVTAFAEFVLADFADNTAIFQLGYAVPDRFRGKGFATRLVRSAIDELRNGLNPTPIAEFVVDAVVGVDNIGSQKVAARTLTPSPDPITDSVSGLPALHYRVRVAC